MCAVGCADKICFRRLSHNLLCSRFIRGSWGKFGELMVIHQIRQSFPPYSMIYTHTYLEVEYCRYLVDISYVYHLFKNYITIINFISHHILYIAHHYKCPIQNILLHYTFLLKLIIFYVRTN